MKFHSVCPTCGHQLHRPKNNLIKQREKAARALAAHLAFTFNIPVTNSLVFVLGTGQEPTNHAALKSWVLQRMAHVDQWPLPSSDVHELIMDLERELSQLLDDIRSGRLYV